MLALVAGFVWDFFLFQRPDEPLENILIISHLAIAAGAIILLALRGREVVIGRIPLILLAQFNFGALAKSLMVLYVKSGTWDGSALFFLLFTALILINEFSKGRFGELRAHITTLYVFILLYAALIVPVLLGESDVRAFAIACVASVVALALFLTGIRAVIPTALRGRLHTMYGSLFGILAVFCGLYVFNIIPPVPIALQNIGVYHSVTHEGDVYVATYERPAWYLPWRSTAQVYHTQAGESAYCFSSIFAPDDFSAPIYHVWERYDETLGAWKEEARIAYAISGGRSGGYRGYTVKSTIAPGEWRCSAQVERGALIGRVAFTVTGGTPLLREARF